jgi:hypothetical protein
VLDLCGSGGRTVVVSVNMLMNLLVPYRVENFLTS